MRCFAILQQRPLVAALQAVFLSSLAVSLVKATDSWVELPCDRRSAVKSSISAAMSETSADPLEIIKLGRERLLELKRNQDAKGSEDAEKKGPAQRAGKPKKRASKKKRNKKGRQGSSIGGPDQSKPIDSVTPPAPKLSEPSQVGANEDSPITSESANTKDASSVDVHPGKQIIAGLHEPELQMAEQLADHHQHVDELSPAVIARDMPTSQKDLYEAHVPPSEHLLEGPMGAHEEHPADDDHHEHLHPEHYDPSESHRHQIRPASILREAHSPALLPFGPPRPSPSFGYQHELMEDLSLKHPSLPEPHQAPPAPQLDASPVVEPAAAESPDWSGADADRMSSFSDLPGFSGSLPEPEPPKDYNFERKYIDERNPSDPYYVHIKQQERRRANRLGGSHLRQESSTAYSLKNPRSFRRRFASSESSYTGNPGRFQNNNYYKGGRQGWRNYGPKGQPLYAPLAPLTPLATYQAVAPLIYNPPSIGVAAAGQAWSPASYGQSYASAGYSQQPGYYASAYASVPLYYDGHQEGPMLPRYPSRRQAKRERQRANKRARQAAAATASAAAHVY